MLPPSQSGWTVAAAAAAVGGASCLLLLTPDSLALEALKRLSFKDLAGSALGGDTCKVINIEIK
jgi:hypothetical protein